MRIFRLFAIAAAVFALATFAAADAVPAGTVLVNFQPVNGANQGSVSGNFVVNATGALQGYDFQVTQSADCCGFSTGFPSFEYLPSNTGAASSFSTLGNGNQQLVMLAEHGFGGSQSSGLVLTFLCNGITSCFTNNIAVGNSFSVTISEFGFPDGIPSRTTGTVFLNVTDPAGDFAFNADNAVTAGNTLIGGNQGGGGNDGGGVTAPEPASLMMLGSGLLGLPLFRRFKLRK